MRIAFLSHEYPPFSGGGIGTYTVTISELLARKGHDVHVLTNRFDFGTRDSKHALDVYREGNLWIHRIPAVYDDWTPRPPHDRTDDLEGLLFTHGSPYLYYAELVAHRLQQICLEHKIDLIEAPECAAEGYLAIRRRRLGVAFAQQPIVVTLHSPIHEIHQYNLLPMDTTDFLRRNAMEEYCIRHADCLNAPSQALAIRVQSRLGIPERDWSCEVIRLPMPLGGVPSARLEAGGTPTPQAPPTNGRSPTLLFVGRLEPRKGPRLLVDAALRVMPEVDDLRVVFVGRDCPAGEAPGSMMQFLKKCIPAQWRGRFTFCGPLPREEVLARYAGATACVFPAPWDNFPLSCVEAMGVGACVITSDGSGVAEIIRAGQNGLIFKSGSVESLARAIHRILQEPDLAKRLREAAPASVSDSCDPDRVVSQREQMYERVLDHQRGRTFVATGSRARSIRVAMLVIGTGSPECARRTLDAASGAARAASIDLNTSVIAAGPNAVAETLQMREWVDGLSRERPDFVIVMQPGSLLETNYFSLALGVFAVNPQAGWVAAWSRPMDKRSVPYAGFDFIEPLAVLDFQRPPHALIRHDLLERSGGWNLELPQPWRDWDLYLALLADGHPGLVVPEWLSGHGSAEHSESDFTFPLVSRLRERSRLLFETHALERSQSHSPQKGPWARAAKSKLKARWPWFAYLYRKAKRRLFDR